MVDGLMSSVIFPYVNFLLFLAILIAMARKPVQVMVAQKREDFVKQAAEAEKAKNLAEEKLSELRLRMQRLDSELTELKNRAIKEADEEAHRIIEAGKQVARRIEEDAQRTAAAEADRMKQDLYNEVFALVRASVLDRVSRDFSPADHTKYVRQRIGDLNKIEVKS